MKKSTTLNTLTAIRAAETSGLFSVMNAISEEAPEAAATLIENCTQHFNGVLAYAADGEPMETIGDKFGCGKINALELFTAVADQASEDLHVYITKRDVAPINIVADGVCFGDRLLNVYTGKFELVTDVYDNHADETRLINISTKLGTKLILSPADPVVIKR